MSIAATVVIIIRGFVAAAIVGDAEEKCLVGAEGERESHWWWGC